jgi:hypothetical protein
MKRKITIRKRLAALNYFYEEVRINPHLSVNDIARKFQISNAFFSTARASGIIGFAKDGNRTLWSWKSEARPNIYMVKRLYRDEGYNKIEAELPQKRLKNEQLQQDLFTSTTKRCTKCGKHKQLSDFNKNRREKSGLQSWCRECASVYNNCRLKKNEVYHHETKTICVNTTPTLKEFIVTPKTKKVSKKYGIIRKFLRWIWVFIIISNI